MDEDTEGREAVSIVFGEVIPCSECGGTGELPLSDREKLERAKELRRAKRANEPAPPLVHSTCGVCQGTGVLKEKGKYK